MARDTAHMIVFLLAVLAIALKRSSLEECPLAGRIITGRRKRDSISSVENAVLEALGAVTAIPRETSYRFLRATTMTFVCTLCLVPCAMRH